MSHTVKAKFQIDETNIDALRKVIEASDNATWLGQGTYPLFSEQLTGEAFKLKNWKYPCVVTEEGLQYDNYKGHWGKQAELDEIIQRTVEHVVTESAAMSGFIPYGSEFNDEGQLVVTLRTY